MKVGTEVSLGLGDIVLDRDSSPFQKGAWLSIFGHVRSRQTAGCMKMPLGLEVGPGPGDILFDGDLAPPPQKGEHSSPPP